jgi:uncharacterized protein with GYD domain
MAKYLFRSKYTEQGVRGLVKEGGVARKTAIEAAIKSLEGKLESIYFALGDDDIYITVDLPNSVAAAAFGMQVGASGTARIQTVALLTAEEVDQAVKKPLNYRPPAH